MTAGFGPAVSQAQATVHAAALAGPPAGYTPISTGQGMCLDDTDGVGRDGQPVQLYQCLGNREQAWQAEPDGTIRNANGYCLGTGSAADRYAATANGTRLVMVDCSRSYRGSYWTISPADHQIVNKYAVAAMDNRGGVQRDGNPVQLSDVAAGPPQSGDWTVVPSGGGSPVVTPGEPPDLHVDRANMVTPAGQVFVPRGFTLSTLQYTQPYLDANDAYSSVLLETEAQIDAIAGAWHGNIVRLQIEQDDLVRREAVGDHSYLNLIRAAVGYAKAKGLVVVLNAQTEPSGERFSQNEPLPTMETVEFWQTLQPYYGNDASVIIDVFNEPRPLAGTSVKQYMKLWKDGGRYQGTTYLGHQRLAEMLRADGYATNMLWVEPPGNAGQRRARGPAATRRRVGRRRQAGQRQRQGPERGGAESHRGSPRVPAERGAGRQLLVPPPDRARRAPHPGELGRAVRRSRQGRRAVRERRRVGDPLPVHGPLGRERRQRPVLERRPHRRAQVLRLPAAPRRGHDRVDAERRRGGHRHHRRVRPWHVHHHGDHGRLAGLRDRQPGAGPGRADHGVVRPAGGLGTIWYTSN